MFPLLEKTSTVATPIEPDILQGFGPRDHFARRRQALRKLTLISTVTPILPVGSPDVTAIPAAWSASAVITPPWKWPKNCTRSSRRANASSACARLDLDNAEARGVGEAPGS